ncbi:MAG: hypothetical protein Q4C96_08055 [Planctomycetia bacterium]|nr:hypothetical protein [Planctomycetia bacterium]
MSEEPAVPEAPAEKETPAVSGTSVSGVTFAATKNVPQAVRPVSVSANMAPAAEGGRNLSLGGRRNGNRVATQGNVRFR